MSELAFADVRRLLLDQDVAHDRKDALLLTLVNLAKVDPEGAACVAACLHPGLARLTSRDRDILDRDEAWAGLLAALTRQVRRFDVERRNQFVAADLLRDAAHELRRTARRERTWRNRLFLQKALRVEVLRLGGRRSLA